MWTEDLRYRGLSDHDGLGIAGNGQTSGHSRITGVRGTREADPSSRACLQTRGSHWRHERVASLDGVRAVAIWLVLLAHLGWGWSFAGALGVDVFFVLSGFLITSVLLDEVARRRSIGFGAFYARRALRLYPPVLVALVIFFPFHRYLFDLAGWQSVRHWVKASLIAVTYTTNIGSFKDQMGTLGHFWSLAVEEQFYLVWPAVLLLVGWLTRRRASRMVCAVAAIGAVSLAVDLWSISPSRGKAMYTYEASLPMHAWELLLGCCLSIALTSDLVERLRNYRAWSFLGIAGLAVIIWSAWTHGISQMSDDAYRSMWRSGALETTAATAALLLCLRLNSKGVVPTLLRLRPIAWTGRISYGLYVYHYPIYHILAGVFPGVGPRHPRLFAILQISCSYAVAAASLYLVERPFLRIKDSDALHNIINRRAVAS